MCATNSGAQGTWSVNVEKRIEKVRRVHVSFYTDARIQTYFMRHPAAYILPIGLKHPGESIWKQARAGFQLCQWIDKSRELFCPKRCV